MYDWLSRWLPRPVAGVALALWYALLILGIMWGLGEADVPFRYGEI